MRVDLAKVEQRNYPPVIFPNEKILAGERDQSKRADGEDRESTVRVVKFE